LNPDGAFICWTIKMMTDVYTWQDKKRKTYEKITWLIDQLKFAMSKTKAFCIAHF